MLATKGYAAFISFSPKIGTNSNAIVGTAIAVALMPPLCVVGLTISGHQWSLAKGAAMLFGTNFLGIALACMVVYIIDGRFERHNRFALATTAIVTAALLFPLGASFF